MNVLSLFTGKNDSGNVGLADFKNNERERERERTLKIMMKIREGLWKGKKMKISKNKVE